MNGETAAHVYRPGDSVLAHLGDARVPGVVESASDDQIEVMLAQPWTDEHGNPSHTMMLSPGQIEPLPDAAELTQ
jgi:hypothetical protein